MIFVYDAVNESIVDNLLESLEIAVHRLGITNDVQNDSKYVKIESERILR